MITDMVLPHMLSCGAGAAIASAAAVKPCRGSWSSLASSSSQNTRLIRTVVSASKKGRSFGDQLLDYIEGGPKLRKWYGASDELPRDGGEPVPIEEEIEEESEDEVRDAILVTDADSMTGQLMIVSLILKRVRIRALVKDDKELAQGFGSYVESVVGDVEDQKSLKTALKGVRAVVCPTKVGALGNKGLLKGVEHLVFLSQFAAYNSIRGLAALLNSSAKKKAEEDEMTINNLGIPCTIIRCATLQDEPGGQKGLIFEQGSAQRGVISREDAAMICVKALDFPPKETVMFEVANGENFVEDWDALFESLNGTS